MRIRSKKGFTLVELLVVIAIIGILVALLLPAVQAAREAARRMQCSNQLKQLALACHNYHDVHKRLPWNWDSAHFTDGNNGAVADQPFSWIVATLPFLEQQGLYDKIDFTVPGGNESSVVSPTRGTRNVDLRQNALPFLQCPSNGQPKVRANQNRGYIAGSSGGSRAAGTDYVGNMGHVWAGWRDCGAIPEFIDRYTTGTTPEGRFNYTPGHGESDQTPWVNGNADNELPRLQGLFYYRGSARLGDIIDGTSNTICVFEDMHWEGGTWGPGTDRQTFDKDHTNDSAWMSPLGALGNLREPMNNENPAWQQGRGDVRCHGWSSNHPSTAGCGLADGSVQFYAENMEHELRYALATKANGEPLNPGN